MIELFCGNCLDVLKLVPDNHVDAIVTDPPYGLAFMGKKWDYDVPSEEIWRECLRVLKPGGHMLAFAGTRTQHRMAVRIEDAGFEIRDMIAWVYGSGFPKSHNLSGEWQGWGTALKPSLEPVTVARKPFKGTVAENVLEHGTGALSVDGCRVGDELIKTQGGDKFPGVYGTYATCPESVHQGRWPANLIHDGSEEVEDLLQSAARFFYCAKASKRDRDEGLEGFTTASRGALNLRSDAHAERNGNTPLPRANHHPTVKPTDLMRYLCRLVTPPGGTVLDPFMGSGSTGKGAVLEGFGFMGIELDEEYFKIAGSRIAKAQEQTEQTLFKVTA